MSAHVLRSASSAWYLASSCSKSPAGGFSCVADDICKAFEALQDKLCNTQGVACKSSLLLCIQWQGMLQPSMGLIGISCREPHDRDVLHAGGNVMKLST